MKAMTSGAILHKGHELETIPALEPDVLREP